MEIKEADFLDTYDENDRSLEATEWLPRVVLHRKATEADVAKLEKTLGVSLPKDYRSVLLKHQGKMPTFGSFAYEIIGDKSGTGKWVQAKMGPLYHCLDDADPNLQDYHILAYSNNRKCSTTDLLAFSETTEGNVICVRPNLGPVVVLDVKRGVGIAGENFTDFLWRMRLENYNTLLEKQDAQEEEEEEEAEEEEEEDESVMTCNECHQEISEGDTYWHCQQCEDYDECERCHCLGRHKKSHTVEKKLKGPRGTLKELLDKMTPYKVANSNEEEDEEVHNRVNQARRSNPSRMILAWDPPQFKKFPKLLKKDLRENLLARIDYYTEKGYLTNFTWLQLIVTEQHAIQCNQLDHPHNFAYSVGFYYLFAKPEILLISEDKTMGSYRLACTINYVSTYAKLIRPVTAGMKFKEISPYCNDAPNNKDPVIDYHIYDQCEFTVLTADEKAEYMDLCTWFHINFRDGDFPGLVCRLTAGQ